MESNKILSALGGQAHAIDKAIERMAQQLGSKQFPQAGIELGRVIQAAHNIVELEGIAADALWRDSQQ